ncbi:MAG: hypothetical protein ACOYBE_12795 [Blautia sp.]|jgi:hypothetical protein
MKMTLYDLNQAERFFEIVNGCEQEVTCYGMDLRGNRDIQSIMCGISKGAGIGRLELNLTSAKDFRRLMDYLQEPHPVWMTH